MRNETIRVGIVGAGANTRLRHIPGLKAMKGVEVVSVANRSRESGERVARKFGIPTVYDTWRELVEADDTNALCIGTWPYLHCPVTLAALENGKHVLCEARMAMNASEARAMLEAARRRPHLVAQLVPAPHTLKADRAIQALIAEGYVGDLLAVELGGSVHRLPYLKTFGDVPVGEELALPSSRGRLSFSVNMGSFAARHGVVAGQKLRVSKVP